jgi:outer membrane protein assembly factor BamD
MALAVSACSKDKKPEDIEEPVDKLYNSAQDLLQKNDFEGAAKGFEEVERQHPYSPWATRAEIMAAYSYYQADKYDESIAAAQRFIDLHPGHQDAPYAYYLIGVDYYEQISDIQRDQEMTQKALTALGEVVRRYPDSAYARDAQLKIDLAQDHLAGKEMEIGRYYQDRKEYLAAINRFRAVVEHYQTTSQVPEALMRLTECYLALGVHDEAQTAAAVLGYNYPGSKWYERSYALLEQQHLQPQKSEGSWLSRFF